MSDRLQQLAIFVRTVETGSFSKVAREFGLSQPSVSRTVAALEDRLGVKLLTRTTRQLSLTDAGETLLTRAREALASFDEAEGAARGAGTALTGRLRFCSAVTFARLHIIPHLPLFFAQHPALAVEAILDDRTIDLIEEGIDVALRMGALDDSTLTARKIGESPRIVLGTPAYFAARGEPTSPAELQRHSAVIYAQRGGGANWTFRHGTREEAVTLKESLRVTAAEGVREAVFAGLGLAVATEWMFQPELDNGTVKQVMRDWELPPLDLSAVFPSGRRASAKARAFAAFVEDQLRHSHFAR